MADSGFRPKEVTLRHLKTQHYNMKESLRALRTNLQFCGDDVKVVLFTSCVPNEGKSTVVMDLARSLVDARKSVLVIDADTRKSVLGARLGGLTTDGEDLYGLSHYLSGQKRLAEVIYATQEQGLYMVFSGPSVPNSTEILEKQYFTDLIAFGRKYFDYVLIDCPPIGAAIDAAVIARQCDGAILVTAQGVANSRLVANAKKQLEASGIRILGAVLNKVDMRRNAYYGRYYGKYYGSYYGTYGQDGNEDPSKSSEKNKKR